MKIIRDEKGNVYAQQLGDCQIIVKGYKDPESWCISDNVRGNQGRLSTEPLKVSQCSRLKPICS